MKTEKSDVGYWIDGKDLAQQLLAAEQRGYRRAIADLRDEEALKPFVIAYREREREAWPIRGYTPSNLVLAEYLESRASIPSESRSNPT